MQKSIVAKLEMRGLEDKAIEILKKAVIEAKENSFSHHEYEYQMLLVEALIYKVFLITSLLFLHILSAFMHKREAKMQGNLQENK